jgi:hypothetical protein
MHIQKESCIVQIPVIDNIDQIPLLNFLIMHSLDYFHRLTVLNTYSAICSHDSHKFLN